MADKSYAVIGLGQFGLSIVKELAGLGKDVIAIDKDEEAVKKAAAFVPTAFVADSTNEKALRELDVHKVTHAIVAFGDSIQGSILTTVILTQLAIPSIVVRVDDVYYDPILKKLGATEVIHPQQVAGVSLANRLDDNDFLDFYKLDENFSVVKITIGPKFFPVQVSHIDARNRFNINIVLLIKNTITTVPKADDIIQPGDKMIIVGTKKEINTFAAALKKGFK
jgi:trk system potassium uptake protein TrkA